MMGQRSSGSRGPIALGAILVVALVATVLAVGTATAPPAGAAELVRVADCGELDALTSPDQGVVTDDGGAGAGAGGVAVPEMDTADAAPAPAAGAPATTGAPGAEQRSSADDLATEGFAATGEVVGNGGDGGTGATNVQVEGVDELDVAEIIGGRVLTTGPTGAINLVEPDGTVRVGPTLSPWSTTFSWDGGPVAWAVAMTEEPGTYRQVVTLARVQVEDLTVSGSWSTPGYLVGARAVGGQVRLIVADDVWSRPVDVLPFELEGDPAVPCEDVWRPAAATRPGVTDPGSLLAISFDPDRAAEGGALVPAASGQVVGGGELVYATTGAVYVATMRYDTEAPSTEIHRFDAATMTPTGSGTVPGRLISQFAMDEHQGVLRVGATVESFGGFVGRPMPIEPGIGDGEVLDEVGSVAIDPVQRPGGTDNLVITLDTDGALDEIGRLGGLGKPGETIHGIRFQGDIGYVVTFLQTDPLYTIDLSDPANPRKLGELEIPGFSAYLHPLAPGRVVGIGVDEVGRAQAQLFDVSDVRDPRSLDVLPLGDSTPAMWDHLAFAALGEGRFAVPVESWDARPVPMPEPLPLPEPAPEPGPAPQPEPGPVLEPGPEPVPVPEPGPGPVPEPGVEPGVEPADPADGDRPVSSDDPTGVEPAQGSAGSVEPFPGEPGAVGGGDPGATEPGGAGSDAVVVVDPVPDDEAVYGPTLSVVVADGSGDDLRSNLRFDLPSFPDSWSGMVRIAAAPDGGYTVVVVGAGVVRVSSDGTVTSVTPLQ